MKIFKTLLALMAYFVVTGCGGGSGSNPEPANPQSESVIAVTSKPSESISETNEIGGEASNELVPRPTIATVQVDYGFDFSNQNSVQITLNRAEQEDSRFHLNLCLRWLNAIEQSLDYDSCLWRGSWESSPQNLELIIPAHQYLLIAELWQIHSGTYSVVTLQAQVQPQIHFDFRM